MKKSSVLLSLSMIIVASVVVGIFFLLQDIPPATRVVTKEINAEIITSHAHVVTPENNR